MMLHATTGPATAAPGDCLVATGRSDLTSTSTTPLPDVHLQLMNCGPKMLTLMQQNQHTISD